MKTNRYIVALAGVMLHLMIGSVYAWSVYTKPIAAQTGWSESSVAFAFSLAIFFLGMSAAFMGRLVEKFGPTLTGTVSAILYGSGDRLDWPGCSKPAALALVRFIRRHRWSRPGCRLRHPDLNHHQVVPG